MDVPVAVITYSTTRTGSMNKKLDTVRTNASNIAVCTRLLPSKSMDDLGSDVSSVSSHPAPQSQRRGSLIPVLDLSGVECEVRGEESSESLAQSKEWHSCSILDEGSRLSPESQKDKNSGKGMEDVLLRVPVGASSRKDASYDYVRASMIFKRIRTLKLNKQANANRDSKSVQDDFDFESEYVIDSIDFTETEAAAQHGGKRTEHSSAAQNPYVQLIIGKKEEGAVAQLRDAVAATELTDEESSSKPPLYLHHHPSVTGTDSDDDTMEDYYENIVIYEELGAQSTATDEQPHVYDSLVHHMRKRTTRMVRGKHRKKLKKYIVKRKSSDKLKIGDLSPTDGDDTTGYLSTSVPETIVESDGNSSEDDPDPQAILKAHEQEVSVVALDETHGGGEDKVKVIRRRHTLDDLLRRPSLENTKSALLDETQYDHMLEVMLSDQEMRQLQDAGAVKIKDISELRAEIKSLVQNAPAVPPPLPDQARPGGSGSKKTKNIKKWSSQSLRQAPK